MTARLRPLSFASRSFRARRGESSWFAVFASATASPRLIVTRIARPLLFRVPDRNVLAQPFSQHERPGRICIRSDNKELFSSHPPKRIRRSD